MDYTEPDEPSGHHHHLLAKRVLPVGSVTLMFSDIENSTTLLKRWGTTRFAALQERHHELLHRAVVRHHGLVVDTMGDGAFIVFESARNAVYGAVAAQRAIQAHAWPDDGRVKVRIGMHTGRPLRLGDDYVGMAVIRAWRISASGHGGQILASQDMIAAAGDRLSKCIRLRDHGDVWFKQLDAPERIYQVLADGIEDVETAPVGIMRSVHYGLYGLPGGCGSRSVAELVDVLAAAVCAGGGEVHLAPAELAALATHQPNDLREYRVCRVAAWIQPIYQLDDRFIPLTLRVEAGEAAGGRAGMGSFIDGDLGSVMSDEDAAVILLLGAPGSGKSTLAGQLEFQLAAAGLRGDAPVTFFVPLARYAAAGPSQAPPSPLDWLSARWRSQCSRLPPLTTLLAEGQVLLILDGLDELPHQDTVDWRRTASLWKRFLHAHVVGTANRAVVTCRTHDCVISLSTPGAPVTIATILPLSDGQVQRLLARRSPGLSGRVWRHIQGQPLLDVLRSPYFLTQYIDDVVSRGDLARSADDVLALLTDRAVTREIDRDNPRFGPGDLVAERDFLRLLDGGSIRPPAGLPARSRLVQGLAELAYCLHIRHVVSGEELTGCSYDAACRLAGDADGAAVVAAGIDLGILGEDRRTDQVFFIRLPVQSYFTALRVSDATERRHGAA